MTTKLSPSTAAVSTYLMLYGDTPSQGMLNSQLGYIASHGEQGYAALLTSITAGQSNMDLARSVVTHAGLVGRSDVVQFVAELFGIYGPSARGQVMLNLAERLLGLTNDSTYGAYATAFSNRIAQGATTPQADKVSLTAQATAFSAVNAGVGALATSNTPYLNTLAAGPYWTSSAITFSFNTAAPAEYAAYGTAYTQDWQPLADVQKAVVRQVMDKLNSLVNLRITEVAADGDIRFNAVSMEAGEAGFGFRPGSRGIDGDVFLNNNALSHTGYYDAGGYGRLVIAHETGHALGLKHPFSEPNKLPAALDDLSHTVMTYNSDAFHLYYSFVLTSDHLLKAKPHGAYPGTYALLDVEALQSIYGANLSTATGNNTYVVDTATGGSLTIWDAGGLDTIDAFAATHRSIVDLRGGTVSSINLKTIDDLIGDGVASLLSQGVHQEKADEFVRELLTRAEVQPRLYTGEGNLQIVQGVLIENLRTGSGHDEVWDNAVDNLISTGAGDDLIHLGEGGFDIIDGGAGTDTVKLTLPQARSHLEKQADGRWLLVADTFAAQLVGVERVQFSDALVTLA